MVVQAVALTALTTAMDGLKATLEKSMEFGEKANKASLALGMTYSEAESKLGPSMDGLRGSIDQRFGAAIRTLEAGLQGNTTGISRLINQQKLTGTQSAKTAKAFATLEAQLGSSRDDTNNLAKSLIITSQEYQISTDKLVEAVDGLKATFPAQALAGMGSKVMEATTQLQAQLGPQLAGPLNNVMKMVMDTSMEGYERLTKLGIGDVRERLSAAKDSAEAQKILKEAFVKAQENFESVAGNAAEGFFQIGVASDIFGQQAINFGLVAEGFGKRVKTEAQEMDKFAKQMNVLRSEILYPLQKLLTDFVYPAFVSLAQFVKKASLIFLDGVRLILNSLTGVYDGVKNFFSKVFKPITESSEFVNKAIHFGIVLPIEGLKIVFNLFMNGLDGIYFATLFVAEGLLKFVDDLNIMGIDVADLGSEISAVQNQMIESGLRIEERNAKMKDSLDRTLMDPGESARQFRESLKASRDDPNGLGNRIMGDMLDTLMMTEETSKLNLKENQEINNKTPELTTSPEFLDETANMLGRSIESILGIGPDTRLSEVVEAIDRGTEVAMANGDKGGASSSTKQDSLE